MTAETPTPMTDSLADCIGGYGHVYQLEQWYDLCCQFEIRCAELERERDQCRQLFKEYRELIGVPMCWTVSHPKRFQHDDSTPCRVLTRLEEITNRILGYE